MMKTLTVAMISASTLAIYPLTGAAVTAPGTTDADQAYVISHDDASATTTLLPGFGAEEDHTNYEAGTPLALPFPYPSIAQSATLRTFQAGRHGTLYTSVAGSPAHRALMYDYPGFALENPMQSAYWLDTARERSSTVTLGYAWRDVSVESSTIAADNQNDGPIRSETPKFDVRSARLSYNLAPNWVVRLSRGTVSTLDQLVPNDEVRRTAIAATYTMPFQQGDWQTTVAWGRNARKFRESTMGYLLESTVRFSGTHALFGRIEQVGSDGLTREDESVQRQLFKMNRLSLGYFYDLRTTGPLHLDVGALVSRHLVPAAMEPSYGNDPTTYMMFVRFRMR
jgi:hypothetical protein